MANFEILGRHRLLTHIIETLKRFDDDPRTEQDRVDKALVAATLLMTAATLLWPESRKTPVLASNVLAIGRAIWSRRALWMPLAPQ